VIKEAILKEQKEPKMAKDEAKKRSDIESKRATKKAKAKDIKEERFRKRQKKPKHLDIFCISEKLLYMSVHVKTVDKNIRTFSLVIFS
jgi:sRNA-binding protein